MAKPSVTTNCVANHYAAGVERIVEFSNNVRDYDAHKGGLISFWNHDDGRLKVSLYRCDPGIEVYVDPERIGNKAEVWAYLCGRAERINEINRELRTLAGDDLRRFDLEKERGLIEKELGVG